MLELAEAPGGIVDDHHAHLRIVTLVLVDAEGDRGVHLILGPHLGGTGS